MTAASRPPPRQTHPRHGGAENRRGSAICRRSQPPSLPVHSRCAHLPAAKLLQGLLAVRIAYADALDPDTRLVGTLLEGDDIGRIRLALNLRRVDQAKPRPRTLRRGVRSGASAFLERHAGLPGARAGP